MPVLLIDLALETERKVTTFCFLWYPGLGQLGRMNLNSVLSVTCSSCTLKERKTQSTGVEPKTNGGGARPCATHTQRKEMDVYRPSCHRMCICVYVCVHRQTSHQRMHKKKKKSGNAMGSTACVTMQLTWTIRSAHMCIALLTCVLPCTHVLSFLLLYPPTSTTHHAHERQRLYICTICPTNRGHSLHTQGLFPPYAEPCSFRVII